MNRLYYLEYFDNKSSLAVRVIASLLVLTLVVFFSLPGFVDGKNSWFLGTAGVIGTNATLHLTSKANCVPEHLREQLGEDPYVDSCGANCKDGET